jgi:multiple RNA-binding domain-containing protein 1
VTTEETLRSIFEKNIDGVRSVRIPRKLAPLRNQEQEAKSLSMGFGFVELSSQSEAEKAIKKLNGKTVDGHAWELTISASKSQSQSKTPSKTGGKNPTKLIVRNVPFQATRTELLKLFGTFGQLRKVRLPKKFDGSHRGFAFVEFLTSKEAQTAMTSLSRTHLYGRHLVLEWATKDDQSVDMLREKAKRDTISISAQPQNKRIKFEDFDE